MKFYIFCAVSYCFHISVCNYASFIFLKAFSADATVKTIPIFWSTVSYWWCLIEITLISVHQILAPETQYIQHLEHCCLYCKLSNCRASVVCKLHSISNCCRFLRNVSHICKQIATNSAVIPKDACFKVERIDMTIVFNIFFTAKKYGFIDHLPFPRRFFATHLPAELVNLEKFRKNGTKVCYSN